MDAASQATQTEPTDDWQQLDLLVRLPEQRTYELIRPVVLFGRSPAERARQTGAPQRTLSRQAARFEREGMASLFGLPKVERHRTLPVEIQRAILALKVEYPPFRRHEIATICGVRFRRRPSHHTVRRILAEDPAPTLIGRRYPPYRAIADPTARRAAVLRLHREGWNIKSIAGYFEIDRRTVYDTLKRWIAEGVPGLGDKSHARTGPRKVGGPLGSMPTMLAVKHLQENPELGAFRVHAALHQIGIEISPSTCGRILAMNRKLYGLSGPTATPKVPKPMPFAAQRRHQYWSVDIRHLDMVAIGAKAYCVSILENYSRAILASGVFPAQDLSAYLMVLYAAIRQHGAPEALVSDSGAVFVTAKQAKTIYAALGIEKREIERRQPWQNYIETTFNVQRRMADWHFANVTSWAELLAVHDQWVVDYNYQIHWAHRERADGRLTPCDVLGWVGGREVSPEELHRLFYRTRFGCTLDKLGYLRFRHWRVYGEHGLARDRAAVWLYGETLTIEFADEPLAQYKVRYQPDKTHLRAVEEPKVFATAYRSPQVALWALNDSEWLKVIRRPEYAPRKPRQEPIEQPALFTLGDG